MYETLLNLLACFSAFAVVYGQLSSSVLTTVPEGIFFVLRLSVDAGSGWKQTIVVRTQSRGMVVLDAHCMLQAQAAGSPCLEGGSVDVCVVLWCGVLFADRSEAGMRHAACLRDICPPDAYLPS